MKKKSNYILSILMFVIMGALFTACSSDQAAIDQAVQQTVEAQQQNQVGVDQDISDTDTAEEEVSIEPTETALTTIESDTIEQIETTIEETTVDSNTPETDSQRIFFIASEEGAVNLFSIKANGEDLQKETNFDTPYYLSVSPDLSYILFTKGDGVTAGIYVASLSDINYSSPVLLPGSEEVFPTEFVWSPDNMYIAIQGSTRSGEDGLYVIDIAANRIDFLVEDRGLGYPGLDIAWSLDGEQLAFVSEENDVNTLLLLPKDGSFLMEVLRDPVSSYIRNLAWSEDGKSITFDQKIDDTEYTKMIDVISGEIVDLSNNVAPDNQGVWSPDGNRVAFVTSDKDEQPYDSNREIYIVNGDGSGLTQFTEYDPNTVWDFCPIWSPDGTQLSFISRSLTTDGGIDELTVSDGSNRIVLMRDSENMSVDCPIAWTP